MRVSKFSFLVGVVLVLAPPCFPHFVKAALGFRLGYSPTEQGYGQKPIVATEKKGMGVQLLSGVNNGGWLSGGGLKAAGSGYGVGLGSNTARVGSPLDAHQGQGSVRHLRILGLNLYLGGRAAQLGIGQPLVSYHPQITKKAIIGAAPYTGLLSSLVRPLNLGANIGAGVKPLATQAVNGGKNVGGVAGLRASVGSPNFGVGFNLGYRQSVNTKSPLGWALGLGNHGPFGIGQGLRLGSSAAPAVIGGSGLLRGHGYDSNLIAHAPLVGAQNVYVGLPSTVETPVITSLESQQISTQALPQSESALNPVASASNQAPTKQQAPQKKQNQNQQNIVAQQSVIQPQHIQIPQQHQARGIQGPLALGSTARNTFLSFLRGRPSILRPTPYQYSFNSPINPQALGSGSVLRSVNPNQQNLAQQRPQAGAQDASAQGWSTLYPIGGQHAAASSPFLNPLPSTGQSLSKLQASLRPGTVANVPLNQQQLSSAQHQVPYLHQQGQQPRYSNFLSQGLRGIFGIGGRQPIQQFPQQYYPQQFQRPGAGAPGAQVPVISGAGGPQAAPQDLGLFPQNLQNPFQNLQNFQNALAQQSPFFHNPVQAADGSAHAQAKAPAFPSIPQFPFTADSPAFQNDPKFRYSHSTHSKPVTVGSYTLNMEVPNQGNGNEQAGAPSNTPIYGPGGRRIKKTKKTRQDIIIMKKQDDAIGSTPKLIRQLPLDVMETSASNNQITLTSSLGSTSWTPMVVVEPPKLSKKSLEPSVIIKRPGQVLSHDKSASSAVNNGSVEHTSERMMILRKRRLNEGESSPTVVPPNAPTTSAPTTTTAAPSPTSSPSPVASSISPVTTTEASA